MRGNLLGIAIKEAARAAMKTMDEADVSVDLGVVGDYRGAKSKERQVTVLSQEQWEDACRVVGLRVPWSARRSNILVGDIRFGPHDVGKKIRIGNDVVLLITGETFPCGRMDEAQAGLKMAIKPEWRGGVTCTVVTGGKIEIGDKVTMK
jgi:MOSC domain-containing protein YiiM